MNAVVVERVPVAEAARGMRGPVPQWHKQIERIAQSPSRSSSSSHA